MIQGFFQLVIALAILLVVSPFLGRYMARVFMGQRTLLGPVVSPLERLLFATSGFANQSSMTGGQYVRAVLVSNLVMGILVYLIFVIGFQRIGIAYGSACGPNKPLFWAFCTTSRCPLTIIKRNEMCG